MFVWQVKASGGGHLGLSYGGKGWFSAVEIRALPTDIRCQERFANNGSIDPLGLITGPQDSYWYFSGGQTWTQRCLGVYDLSLLGGMFVSDRAKVFLRMGVAQGRFRTKVSHELWSREMWINQDTGVFCKDVHNDFHWKSYGFLAGFGARLSVWQMDFGLEYSVAIFNKRKIFSGEYVLRTALPSSVFGVDNVMNTFNTSNKFGKSIIHTVMLTASMRFNLSKWWESNVEAPVPVK